MSWNFWINFQMDFYIYKAASAKRNLLGITFVVFMCFGYMIWQTNDVQQQSRKDPMGWWQFSSFKLQRVPLNLFKFQWMIENSVSIKNNISTNLYWNWDSTNKSFTKLLNINGLLKILLFQGVRNFLKCLEISG